MTDTEREHVTNLLLRRLKKEVLGNMENFPAEWDGLEIAKYITDIAESYCKPMSNGRKRKYTKAVSNFNL